MAQEAIILKDGVIVRLRTEYFLCSQENLIKYQEKMRIQI